MTLLSRYENWENDWYWWICCNVLCPSSGMMSAWQVCQGWSIRNGAVVSSICSWVTPFLWSVSGKKKTKICTSRNGNGSKEKVKNRKAKDLVDWHRKYRSEQAQNRVGDKAEKERGCWRKDLSHQKQYSLSVSVFAKAHSVFVMIYGNNSRGKRNT